MTDGPTSPEGADSPKLESKPPPKKEASTRGEASTTPTYNIGVTREDEIFKIRSYELADRQLRDLLSKGKFYDVGAFFRKVAVRTAYPYFRQKLAHRAEEIMRKNNNPEGEYNLIKYGKFNLFSHAEATDADLNRAEYEESQQAAIDSAIFLGQKGAKFEGYKGVEVTGTLREKFETGVFMKIVNGEDGFKTKEEAQKSFANWVKHNIDEGDMEELFGAKGSEFGKVADIFSGNIFEAAKKWQSDRDAGKFADDEGKEFIHVYFAKIREGADTQLRDKVDNVIKKLKSNKILGMPAGAMLSPIVMGAAGSVLGLAAGRTLSTTAGVALSAIPVGGLAAGGITAGLRAGGEAREDVLVHSRETASGMTAEPNAKRRAELDEIIKKLGRAKPSELLGGGGDELLVLDMPRLSVDKLKEMMAADPTNEATRKALRMRYAEIKGRLDMGDKNRVDYITFSDGVKMRGERLALIKAANDLQELLRETPETSEELKKAVEDTEKKLIDNKKEADRAETAYIRKRQIQAVVTGGAVGFTAGILAREGINLGERVSGHRITEILDNLRGGAKAELPQTGGSTSVSASELHEQGGPKPSALAPLHETLQPAVENKNISVPEEWKQNSVNVDERIWEHGNDQLFHTIKDGDKLILDITRMHLSGQEGFAFTTADGQTIFVPHELLKNNQLVLDPNNFKDMIPGTKLSVGEFTRMIINQDALAKLPNGDIATELTNHREVFNTKFIEAAQMVHDGAKNIIHAQATIQGTGHLPDTINITTGGETQIPTDTGTGSQEPVPHVEKPETGTQSPLPTQTPVPHENAVPSASAAPHQTESPSASAVPTNEPTKIPEPTQATPVPHQTEVPTASATPSVEPTQTPQPTPTASPLPTESHTPTPTSSPAPGGQEYNAQFPLGNEPIVPLAGEPRDLPGKMKRGEAGPPPASPEPTPPPPTPEAATIALTPGLELLKDGKPYKVKSIDGDYLTVENADGAEEKYFKSVIEDFLKAKKIWTFPPVPAATEPAPEPTGPPVQPEPVAEPVLEAIPPAEPVLSPEEVLNNQIKALQEEPEYHDILLSRDAAIKILDERKKAREVVQSPTAAEPVDEAIPLIQPQPVVEVPIATPTQTETAPVESVAAADEKWFKPSGDYLADLEKINSLSQEELIAEGKRRHGEDWDGLPVIAKTDLMLEANKARTDLPPAPKETISTVEPSPAEAPTAAPIAPKPEVPATKEEELIQRIIDTPSAEILSIGKERFGDDWNGSISELRTQLIEEAIPAPIQPVFVPSGNFEEDAETVNNLPSSAVLGEGKRRFGKDWEGSIAMLRVILMQEANAARKDIPITTSVETPLTTESIAQPEPEVQGPTEEQALESVPAELVEAPTPEPAPLSFEDLGPNKAYFEAENAEIERVRKLSKKQLLREWQKLTGKDWQGNDILQLKISVAQRAAGEKVIKDAIKLMMKTEKISENEARERLMGEQLPNQPK